MANILKLNEISPVANKAFKADYKLSKDIANPEGIILRSFNMHEYPLPDSLLCVGRAGAGVNNIPIDKCTAKGIVVFNTPGANANAVKELVICSMLLGSRKIYDGINWTKSLKGKGAEVTKLVESGKGSFVGGEILGKKLGVIGLGAIGILVANSAIELGMNVVGYDPYISIDGAWNLDHNVKKELDINKIFSDCDYITLHVPLLNETKELINAESLLKVKEGVCIINCARGELVNNEAIIAAVKSGKVARYITDFPCEEVLNTENIITIPHLGASTPEAEDNCAYMAAQEMTDYIENGNITNSVNFPNCNTSREGKNRLTIIHNNVKNVLKTITEVISNDGINISNFVSQARGNYAYSILDLDEDIQPNILDKISKLENIIKIRVIK